jgi:hypothetical protein
VSDQRANYYVGRFDVPITEGSLGSIAKNTWKKVNKAAAVGFSFDDYSRYVRAGTNEKLMVRACVAFSDSSGPDVWGPSSFNLKIRRTDGAVCNSGNCERNDGRGGQTQYESAVGGTWSGSSLIHHDCGDWMEASKLSCGYSWGDTCQVDVAHGQGVNVDLYEFDLEVGVAGSTGMPTDHYVGRFDIPVSWNGVVPKGSYSKISSAAAVGFSISDYNQYVGSGEDLMIRGCAHFSDSSGPGVWGPSAAKFKLRRTDGAVCNSGNCGRNDGRGGQTQYEAVVGGTWSGSSLIHHDCGHWIKASSISCGYSWGDTCQVDVGHGQGVNINVHEYDFEVAVHGTSSAQDKVYVGRFDIPVAHSGSIAKGTFTKISKAAAVGFSFSDYNQYVTAGKKMYVRGCASFSDSSGPGAWGPSALTFRLRRTNSAVCNSGNCGSNDGRGGQKQYDSVVGGTWSGSSLIHHDCGDWIEVSKISCGYSWGDTCQVDLAHGQGVNVNVHEFDFEVAVF